jgi:hypothetical protein
MIKLPGIEKLSPKWAIKMEVVGELSQSTKLGVTKNASTVTVSNIIHIDVTVLEKENASHNHEIVWLIHRNPGSIETSYSFSLAFLGNSDFQTIY